jgi:hypothetical protein
MKLIKKNKTLNSIGKKLEHGYAKLTKKWIVSWKALFQQILKEHLKPS